LFHFSSLTLSFKCFATLEPKQIYPGVQRSQVKSLSLSRSSALRRHQDDREGNFDIVMVKAILDHADIRMTARHAHATSAAERLAVEALAEGGKLGDAKVTKQKRQARWPAVS
jgi:hypothetical protein